MVGSAELTGALHKIVILGYFEMPPTSNFDVVWPLRVIATRLKPNVVYIEFSLGLEAEEAKLSLSQDILL